jgi:hypothetical protein
LKKLPDVLDRQANQVRIQEQENIGICRFRSRLDCRPFSLVFRLVYNQYVWKASRHC